MSVLAGCSLLEPGFNTLLARPEAVFEASAGGAATSGGAGIVRDDWAKAVALRSRVIRKVRIQ